MSNKKYKLEDIQELEGRTKAQMSAIEAYETKDNIGLCLTGSAGTGKTYLGMSLGLEDVLDRDTPYDKLIIIRSVVPTREMGYMPGTKEEKEEVFTLPYKGICAELFGRADAWDNLIKSCTIEFESTSFIRGATFNNAIVLVDEMQNLNFHELDSVITRIGRDSRIILAGDYYQSDFRRKDEKDGIASFLNIVEELNHFEVVEFTWADIVRSGLVRDYIMTKERLTQEGKLN